MQDPGYTGCHVTNKTHPLLHLGSGRDLVRTGAGMAVKWGHVHDMWDAKLKVLRTGMWRGLGQISLTYFKSHIKFINSQEKIQVSSLHHGKNYPIVSGPEAKPRRSGFQEHQGMLAWSSCEDNSREKEPRPSQRVRTSSNRSKAPWLTGRRQDLCWREENQGTHMTGMALQQTEPEKLSVEQD